MNADYHPAFRMKAEKPKMVCYACGYEHDPTSRAIGATAHYRGFILQRHRGKGWQIFRGVTHSEGYVGTARTFKDATELVDRRIKGEEVEV